MSVTYDCDTIISMEELGVGPEEVLQYARALFSRREMTYLVQQLQRAIGADDENVSAAAPICVAEPVSEPV